MPAPNVYIKKKTITDKILEVVAASIFFIICVVVGAFMLLDELITHLVENSLFEIATGIYLLVLAVLAIRNYLRPEKLTPMAIKMTAAIVVATVSLFSDVLGENLGMTLLDGSAAHFAIAAMFLTSSLYVGWRVIKLPVDLIGATRAAQPAPNSKQNTTGDRFYDPL